MPTKNIIFCADGTWNSPIDEHTNVYDFFELLQGALRPGFASDHKEQEKEYRENNQVVQIAKYIHGVGDTDNKIAKYFEGMTGGGTLARIIRGYTFISRNYEVGDKIFVVGFSRGAYTARALADFIAVKGLLPKSAFCGKETGYQKGVMAWYDYRECLEAGPLAELCTHLGHLKATMEGFWSGKSIFRDHFVETGIAAVAAWDTVGSMGIPIFVKDRDGAGGTECYDPFRLCDENLNRKIEHGFHAVSLDEDRCEFTPTLWNPDDRVKQIVFPGFHADVGGGYRKTNDESGLSSMTLQWMVDELMPLGVLINKKAFADLMPPPDPAGKAHREWDNVQHIEHKRTFDNITGHCSIALRASAGKVYPDPTLDPVPYEHRNIQTICTPTGARVCANCRYGSASSRS